MAKSYWLMKSEPDVFSIDDLEKCGEELWDGVRNYQARNLMRDEMKVGDEVLFYHSNAKPSGVAGLAKVVKKAAPDPTQFDPKSKYYDPKATPEAPRWFGVTVGYVETFDEVISLDELKQQPDLDGLLVIKRGQRLSVQPVSKQHFSLIRKMGRQ